MVDSQLVASFYKILLYNLLCITIKNKVYDYCRLKVVKFRR